MALGGATDACRGHVRGEARPHHRPVVAARQLLEAAEPQRRNIRLRDIAPQLAAVQPDWLRRRCAGRGRGHARQDQNRNNGLRRPAGLGRPAEGSAREATMAEKRAGGRHRGPQGPSRPRFSAPTCAPCPSSPTCSSFGLETGLRGDFRGRNTGGRPKASPSCANVDAQALPDYVARSFEAGILPCPDEPLPPARTARRPGEFLRSAGGFGNRRKPGPN